MRMFKPRHELGLSFKTADEIRMVGKSRENNFYGNFTFYIRLHRTIDGTHATHTNSFRKCIAANGTPGQVFTTDLFHRRRRGHLRQFSGFRSHRSGAPHKVCSFFQWNGKRHRQSFCNLH